MMVLYFVFDVVSMYYLYMKYVYFFIFVLLMIILFLLDEVFCKGFGILCEVLFMVEVYYGNIVCLNK